MQSLLNIDLIENAIISFFPFLFQVEYLHGTGSQKFKRLGM